METLIASINGLPPPPKVAPPQERWLVVRGIRGKQWFKYIYDRADVPAQVEELYEITGAYLEWFIPKMEGRQVSTNLNVDEFHVARNAPKAVLFVSTNIQILDLNEMKVQETVPISLIPLRQGHGHIRAVSPDGRILVESCSGGMYLDEDGVCAIDLMTKKVLWKKEPLEHKGYFGSHVVIGGDKGQYLFTAGAHTIERWDLTTGKCLAVLATNQPWVKWVEVSQNGKVFAAGFDNGSGDIPTALTIWRANEDKPATHLETGQTSACLSPDGQIMALNRFGRQVIELVDWEHGTTKEVPLRVPYGDNRTSEMFWSPKGNFLAARLSGAYDMMVVYETAAWKPLVLLPSTPSDFDEIGHFLQLLNGDIYSLNPAAPNGWNQADDKDFNFHF